MKNYGIIIQQNFGIEMTIFYPCFVRKKTHAKPTFPSTNPSVSANPASKTPGQPWKTY
jgi:hypothetical protein